MIFFTLPNGDEYGVVIDNTPAPGTLSFVDEQGVVWYMHRPVLATTLPPIDER